MLNDKPQGPDCGGPGRDDEDEPGPPGPKSPSNAATYNPRKDPSVISKGTGGVSSKAKADTTGPFPLLRNRSVTNPSLVYSYWPSARHTTHQGQRYL